MRSAKNPASEDESCRALRTSRGAPATQGAHLGLVDERVELALDLVVLVLVAQRVEAARERAQAARRADGPGRVGPAEEERDDVARRLLLRADLLVHERLERGDQRGVLGAQAAADGVALDGLPWQDALRAGGRLDASGRRRRRPGEPRGRTRRHSPSVRGTTTRVSLSTARQVGGRDGEAPPHAIAAEAEVQARPLLDRPHTCVTGSTMTAAYDPSSFAGRRHDGRAHRRPAASRSPRGARQSSRAKKCSTVWTTISPSLSREHRVALGVSQAFRSSQLVTLPLWAP